MRISSKMLLDCSFDNLLMIGIFTTFGANKVKFGGHSRSRIVITKQRS